MKLLSVLTLLCLTVVACEAAPEPTEVTSSAAPQAPSDDEGLATVDQAITLTCGAVFDCRSYPPPKRSDGRSWLFYGSRYCRNDGGLFCEFVPSGLSASFPTIVFHSVPSSCQTCTSNNGRTSNCSTTNYDISSFTWTCN